ncbi:helix-turn-helix domain-containing protein [Cupriavidus metallidurans]|uniref:helix-turn-helix domain-containing protein n=1 Tax=Cupriavidus metallidurans TaxID=119219 RepID=UPI001CCA1841|nr:helix-turn-helix transcriptional regulator [Cupriavidus metallidurans]UBM09343.1 helix-turn-helix transcriptional regulator [Cupriavidus metallidurans]
MAHDIKSSQQLARANLSANIKALRAQRKLSQEALAHEAKLHRTYVSQVERMIVNVSLDNLVLLADALGVPLRDLFSDPSDPIPPKPRPSRKG